MVYRLPPKKRVVLQVLQSVFLLLCLVRGLTYIILINPVPVGLTILVKWVPIQVWGALWVAASLVALVCLFSNRTQPLFRFACSFVCGMLAAWTITFLTSSIVLDERTAFTSSTVYGAVLCAEVSFLMVLYGKNQ